MKLLPIVLLMLLTGCVMPLKGGKAAFMSGNTSGSVQQPQNPKQESTQVWEKLPDGSEKITTKIGASQKDTAREIGAKLSSLKWVVWVGIAVFLFGVASAFWPPLKLIVGSTTTSAVACVAGVALIVLPVVVVGHEVLILGVALGAVVLYWFSHKYGRMKGFVDANKDGIDDRTQKNL
jgi:hypothetical protein